MTQTKECAFCPETANRSGEHLWSTWIGDLVRCEEIQHQGREGRGHLRVGIRAAGLESEGRLREMQEHMDERERGTVSLE